MNVYLSLLVLMRGDISLLDRYNNHLVRWTLGCEVCSFYCCLIINRHAPSQCQWALVDLIIFLPHNPFYIRYAMLNVAVKGWLLAPSLYMRVANLNLRDMGRQGLFFMKTFPAIPHGVIAQGFHSISGCIPPSMKVVIGNITSTKVLALLNGLEKLGISFVSWIIRAFYNMINPWVGEIFHGLSCRISAICIKCLR